MNQLAIIALPVMITVHKSPVNGGNLGSDFVENPNFHACLPPDLDVKEHFRNRI